MGWLFELHKTQPIAHAVGVLTFVCVLGMALGSVKFRGIGLGTAGVLFAGILVGHFGEAVDHQTLDFVKEFGLILFVFTIGLQLGPGFFAALRQQGVRMNVLAAAIVILGAVSAPLIGWLTGFDAAAVLGIFSGASTNTPSLGAGTQTLSTLPGIAPDRLTLPALAYAVTYPTLPLMLIGIFARAVLKMNFMDLSGLLAGSMTDPPALAFASNIAGSDAPTIAYATVYPLTTLLRILSAQVLAIVLFR